MAFFEKSGNISRVNREINKHLEDINRKYTEIGRIVKLNCLDQVKNDDVRRLASEIDGLLANLKKLQEELNVINGIKICPQCNAQIDINVAFCPSCGTKQAVMQQVAPAPAPVPAPAPAPDPAPVQAAESVDNTPVETSSEEPAVSEVKIPEAPSIAPPPMPAPAAVPEPANTNPAPGQSVIFCMQCGSKEPAGTRFCSQCGSPM